MYVLSSPNFFFLFFFFLGGGGGVVVTPLFFFSVLPSSTLSIVQPLGGLSSQFE